MRLLLYRGSDALPVGVSKDNSRPCRSATSHAYGVWSTSSFRFFRVAAVARHAVLRECN